MGDLSLLPLWGHSGGREGVHGLVESSPKDGGGGGTGIGGPPWWQGGSRGIKARLWRGALGGGVDEAVRVVADPDEGGLGGSGAVELE